MRDTKYNLDTTEFFQREKITLETVDLHEKSQIKLATAYFSRQQLHGGPPKATYTARLSYVTTDVSDSPSTLKDVLLLSRTKDRIRQTCCVKGRIYEKLRLISAGV